MDAWLPGVHIPYEDFSIFINESLPDDELARGFDRIATSMPFEEVDKRRSHLQGYAPATLWAARNSVVAEVLLVDSWEALLESRQRNTSSANK